METPLPQLSEDLGTFVGFMGLFSAKFHLESFTRSERLVFE